MKVLESLLTYHNQEKLPYPLHNTNLVLCGVWGGELVIKSGLIGKEGSIVGGKQLVEKTTFRLLDFPDTLPPTL